MPNFPDKLYIVNDDPGDNETLTPWANPAYIDDDTPVGIYQLIDVKRKTSTIRFAPYRESDDE